jgi:hypothetical protein
LYSIPRSIMSYLTTQCRRNGTHVHTAVALQVYEATVRPRWYDERGKHRPWFHGRMDMDRTLAVLEQPLTEGWL